MHTMTIYTANCRERQNNTHYPNEVQISSLNDLLQAVSKDNLMSAMKDGQRSKDNFTKTNCIYLDLDNTHSENPETWKTLDDIADALPDVEFYYVKSRNYMKVKIKTDKKGNSISYEAREKYHLYFPLKEEISSYTDAENLMLEACGLFPFFDMSAAKPAQFFFGVAKPEGGEYEGSYTIDEYVKGLGAELRQQIEANTADYESNIQSGDYEGGESLKALHKLLSHFGIKTQGQAAEAITPADLEALGDNWLDEIEQGRAVSWFLNWAQEHHVEIKARYKINSITHPHAEVFAVNCPWSDEHTTEGGEKDSVVIIDQNGKISYLCRHGHCTGRNWKLFRYKVEATEAQKDTRPYLDDFLEKIQTEAYKPYETGLRFFDNLLGGGVMQQSLLLLMAAPATGKTTLCQQIAEEMAAKGKPVVYLNFEMSREQMLAKAISGRLSRKGKRVTATDILQGYKWSAADRDEIINEVNAYRRDIYPFIKYNPDKISSNIEAITAYLQEIGDNAKGEGKQAPALIVDYLHLITSATGKDVQELIKQTMDVLKDYAIEYSTFVICIVATNRGSNKTGKLSMESGRDSSSIEYSGDYQLTLNYYDIDSGEVNPTDQEEVSKLQRAEYRKMILRLHKNRFGISGKKVTLLFHAAHNSFYGEYDFMPAELKEIYAAFPDEDEDATGDEADRTEAIRL